VRSLGLEGGDRIVTLVDGTRLRTRCVLVASGVAYRRLEVPRFGDFDGAGIYYAATEMEARMCRGEEVVVVGAGNSAGQAIVYLARHARQVNVLVRGESLGASMSRYLVERIEATPNIELLFNTEVVALEGSDDGSLERVSWRSRLGGDAVTAEIRNLFLFVGADPATGWLDGCGVTLDRGGFVVTGAQSELNSGRLVPQLETSVPGVFAVGDVRSGSVKRVGGAIGEGAQVVAALHGFLGGTARPAL
jgi:thioredoxin reductase (NADPH)